MNIPSKHLEKAVEQLAMLPGIGKRTALRLALHLIKQPKELLHDFADTFMHLKDNVKLCSSCGNIADETLCSICKNPNRDHSTVCIVEDLRDVMAIEETASYKGIYHVLGGIISPIEGIGPNDLNILPLLDKLDKQNPSIQEIIFALSATMEGDTTNFYLYKKIKPFQIKTTCLSRGVAVGTELQYADGLTLSNSLMNRTIFEL